MKGKFITFEGSEGSGKSKKAAEQDAARKALDMLDQEDTPLE